MRIDRRQLPPLTPQDLEWFALRYVERYATTRGKLADYLRRKLRERGWQGEEPADPVALAQKLAALGYVDDRAYAESKAGAMGRRGLGERRVTQALRFAGVEDEDLGAVRPIVDADKGASAVAFARRKRIGPFAREMAERPMQEKQLAAMIRAGHAPALARRIVRMAPGDAVDDLIAGDPD